MSNANRVGAFTQDSFGSFRAAVATQVPLTATGNAIVALPLYSGGTAGSYILRRITVANPANTAGGSVPNCAACNVSITTSSDGNTSNAVVAAATLSGVTGANTYKDLTIAATTAQTAPVLFFNIGASAVANASVTVSVYVDTVAL
jgi:hypothetical protein